MKYIIKDWAGNHLFRDEVFKTFEDGWAFIYDNVEEETEDDGTYDDYFVVIAPKEIKKAVLQLNFKTEFFILTKIRQNL